MLDMNCTTLQIILLPLQPCAQPSQAFPRTCILMVSPLDVSTPSSDTVLTVRKRRNSERKSSTCGHKQGSKLWGLLNLLCLGGMHSSQLVSYSDDYRDHVTKGTH